MAGADASYAFWQAVKAKTAKSATKILDGMESLPDVDWNEKERRAY